MTQNHEKGKNVSIICSKRPKYHAKTAIFDTFPSIWLTNMCCGKQYPDLILKGICGKKTYQLAESGGNEDVFEAQKHVFRG